MGKAKGKKVAKAQRKPRGPKPSITAEVVARVAERYGMGIPLQEALAAEADPKINLETWKKALAAHPELSPPYEAAKGKFLDYAMRKLKDSEKLEHLIFLLRTRRPDLFALPSPVAVNVTSQVNVGNFKELSDAELEKIARGSGSGGTVGTAETAA